MDGIRNNTTKEKPESSNVDCRDTAHFSFHQCSFINSTWIKQECISWDKQICYSTWPRYIMRVFSIFLIMSSILRHQLNLKSCHPLAYNDSLPSYSFWKLLNLQIMSEYCSDGLIIAGKGSMYDKINIFPSILS